MVKTTEEIRHGYCSDDGCYYPEYEAEFEEWLEQVKAKAWEEGWKDGVEYDYPKSSNPYKLEEEQ